MNLKMKLRKFFTLSRGANDGFTLVELIVVIAILAILAGVAVPAYSGYIEKANKAADQQLLAAVNTAFASACAIKGESHVGRNDVGGQEIVGGALEYNGPHADEFDSFYEGGEFKVIKSLVYDMLFGGFKDPATAESLTMAYGDGYITMTGEQINKLLNSTYYGEGMTSEALLGQLDSVVGVASGMGTVQGILATQEYTNSALAALGLTPSGDFATDQQKLLGECQRLALKALGATSADEVDPNVLAAKMNQISTNGLVLYTAQCTSGMKLEDAKNLLTGINSATILQNINNGTDGAIKQTGMNQAALAYGMYYAYVNSEYCTDRDLQGKKDIVALDVTTALDQNDEFQAYLKSSQGQKDMDAYLSALGIINSSTNSTEAVEKLMIEGFNNEGLNGILSGTFGK